MRKIILLLPAIALALSCFAQTAPEIEWQKCLGGSGFEDTFSSGQTADGGYIIAGSTDSNNGQVTGFHGGASDFWVVKLDGSGNLQWQKALGGSASDDVGEIQQTTDGGYIVAGTTSSNNGDVSGNQGSFDCWVVKLDPLGANQWQRTYGGSSSESCWAVQQTTDGGYVLAGDASSTDGDVIGNDGGADMWVVRIDPQGDILWQRTYGGNFGEIAFALDLTSDGGVVLAGYAESNTGDVTGFHGFQDYWVVKLDADGDLEWQKCLGGSEVEIAFGLVQTSDGGYAIAGRSRSADGDVTGNHGMTDMWVVKLDADGNLAWQKALGGSAADVAYDIEESTDGGLIVIGFAVSEDGDVSLPHGGGDIWMVKLNGQGDLLWQKSMGGTGGESARSISKTTDGGYMVGGGTNSNDGDVNGNHGSADFWVVKLSTDPTGILEFAGQEGLSLYPNPANAAITVEFSLENAARVQLRWCDMEGRVVRHESMPMLSAGSHRIPLTMAGLANGTYTLWITANGRVAVRKLVKA